jgi:hypothetical protein
MIEFDKEYVEETLEYLKRKLDNTKFNYRIKCDENDKVALKCKVYIEIMSLDELQEAYNTLLDSQKDLRNSIDMNGRP